jgi:predicted dithiol-disulfide oxidoreductase (DUF899 family)
VLEVARKRRALPQGAADANNELSEGVTLLDLFGDHDTQLVYHLMFHPDDDSACPMCSMWVDGFHGVRHHLQQHTAMAVVGKAPLPKLRAWARRRGWSGLRILSSYGTSFNADLAAEYADGGQRPMASVFVRDGADVRHFYSLPANFHDDTQRGIDLLSPVWNVLDLLPGGRGDWYPDNSYGRPASAP